MDFLTVKALHIIFVVSWFSGLFYIVRLFIYHREAQDLESIEKSILTKQYVLMEWRLWYIITTPAMVLTVVFGVWMLLLQPAFLDLPWMQIKLGLVFLLLIYHFYCQKLMNQMKCERFRWTSNQLRIWNEVATLFLVMIVFIVVLKHSLNWISATVAFFILALLLMIFIRLYKKIREKNNKNKSFEELD
ncbi:MAG: CopD family protein [Flavobacteriia bacterium]|nr:CopD family protein [Flavobacteriia bacterium]